MATKGEVRVKRQGLGDSGPVEEMKLPQGLPPLTSLSTVGQHGPCSRWRFPGGALPPTHTILRGPRAPACASVRKGSPQLPAQEAPTSGHLLILKTLALTLTLPATSLK